MTMRGAFLKTISPWTPLSPPCEPTMEMPLGDGKWMISGLENALVKVHTGKVSQVSGSEFVLFELPEIKFEGNEELIAPYI